MAAEKVLPLMTEEEIETLIDDHYENESQTLTTGAEANLLKFREMEGNLTQEERERWEEIKLVRCTAGAIHDVLLDLRPDSSTFLQSTAVELSRENRHAVYVPAGIAHGFQTLEDDSEVFYQMSEFHHPEAARGVRWDDPAFSIRWPLAIAMISERDSSYPDLEPATLSS